MTEPIKVSAVTRALAAFCRVCPGCTAARRWSKGTFAKVWAKWAAICPACRAHRKIQVLLDAEREQPVKVHRA